MKIILSVALAILFIGCGDDATKEVQKVEEPKDIAKIAPVVKKDEVVVQKTTLPAPAKTGKEIFHMCSACHGANAQKQALGKSQIIKGWNASKVKQALNGYKNGTYGGAMKGVMKGQASKLSKQDIELVSDYISKL